MSTRSTRSPHPAGSRVRGRPVARTLEGLLLAGLVVVAVPTSAVATTGVAVPTSRATAVGVSAGRVTVVTARDEADPAPLVLVLGGIVAAAGVSAATGRRGDP